MKGYNKKTFIQEHYPYFGIYYNKYKNRFNKWPYRRIAYIG